MPTVAAVPLPPVKSGSLANRAFETLRTAIFSGQLQPGAPLRELHLARSLQISQATVRQALVQLEQFGLVVRTPNIGTQVTQLSTEEIRERVELRALLEERAIVQAAPKMTREDYTALAARLDTLTDAISRNAYFEQAQADLEFHRYIWQKSGNRTLYRTLDQLAVPLFAFVSILRGTNRQTLKDVVQSHEGLVKGLHTGDLAIIRDALRQHFDRGFSIPDAIP